MTDAIIDTIEGWLIIPCERFVADITLTVLVVITVNHIDKIVTTTLKVL